MDYLFNLPILDHLDRIEEISCDAGDAIMKVYEKAIDVSFKSDHSPITEADLSANRIIVNALKECYPELPILTEEAVADFKGVNEEGFYWLVDPLDGTKEFIKRNGDFTINIALIENQIPILGVIYIPVTKEIYFASKSIGSFKIKIDNSNFDLTEIISKAKKLPLLNQKKSFTFVASQTHNSKETIDFINLNSKNLDTYEVINRGSSLKLCLIAEGAANMYPRLSPTMEWDIAAGQAIMETLGGIVYHAETGEPLRYNKENLTNPNFIAKTNALSFIMP